MENFSPDDFEKILDEIRDNVDSSIHCNKIRAIESNFNTKGMSFNSKHNPNRNGIVIVGEEKGAIAADISSHDGTVKSFIMRDEKDFEGIKNIVGWLKENYDIPKDGE
jgi:hypothetical protein